VKPKTYVNLSGKAVRQAQQWSGCDTPHTILVYDELDLPAGALRIRAGGGTGGHNGLKSIEAHLGSQEYARLRVGVGPGEERQRAGELRDYVLGDFGKAEAGAIRDLLPTFVEAAELWLREGILPVMNRFPGKPRKDNDE